MPQSRSEYYRLRCIVVAAPSAELYFSKEIGQEAWLSSSTQKFQFDRISLVRPPLSHIKGSGGVHINVARMVERVIEDQEL
jgi:hypothetical protein